jgi:hypothetical protein
VGSRRSSTSDESFNECDEELLSQGDTNAGEGGTGKGGEEDADDRKGREETAGEVIAGVSLDPESEEHKQRPLGCVVDPRKPNPLSGDRLPYQPPRRDAKQHLSMGAPPLTIDSIRSTVSLPLLHPQPFRYGILKGPGITGCPSFGPPGTVKTPVVRASMEEDGCGRLAVSL